MLCVRCGSSNVEGETHCSKCGSSLPKIPSGLSLPAQSRGNLEKLEKICRSFQEGAINEEEFLKSLQSLQEKLEICARSLRNMQLVTVSDSELQALLDEEYTTAIEGTEMMLEAVAEVGAVLEHFDPESYHQQDADHLPELHFENGLSLAKTATETLNRSIETGNDVKVKLGITDETESIV